MSDGTQQGAEGQGKLRGCAKQSRVLWADLDLVWRGGFKKT